MTNRQSQKAGDGSTNIQSEQMVVNVGIDEKRAREIFQEGLLLLKNDYSREALSIANTRVTEFEKSLLPKMEKVEGALEALSDPSFQLLLVDAQKTAASTERSEDYDLLSELLIHRFQKGENRIATAGISRAVKIVDEVSDEALLGLTTAHALATFMPTSADIQTGLDVLNSMFGKLIYGELPMGHDWLDHLDVLNTVRLSAFNGLKKVKQHYSETLNGYVDVGIAKNSEDHKKAIEILKNNGFSSDLLIDHALNSDFLRIGVANRNNIDSFSYGYRTVFESSSPHPKVKLSEAQINSFRSVYDLYSQDEALKLDNVNFFAKEWDKRSYLKILSEWWDSIPLSFTLTSVGKVLAHSNAQRRDKSLPPLN